MGVKFLLEGEDNIYQLRHECIYRPIVNYLLYTSRGEQLLIPHRTQEFPSTQG